MILKLTAVLIKAVSSSKQTLEGTYGTCYSMLTTTGTYLPTVGTVSTLSM